MKGEEEVAIIRDVGIGLRDLDEPVLWFETRLPESVAALQVFFWEDAGKLIKEAGVSNVKDLNGRICFVRRENGLMKFLRLWKER